MKLLLTFSLLLSILSTRAQDTTRKYDYDKTFTKLEIEATYPGGPSAWLRFLNKKLHYPDDAVLDNVQGNVVVQFIVDTAGNTSDIQAVSGPDNGGLREEAVRMIRISGKWVPGIQNGRKVKSYKWQTISFKIDGR
jgi:periplasmic protein TonB